MRLLCWVICAAQTFIARSRLLLQVDNYLVHMQLATLYGGEIEYLFVVEDDADPACAAISSMIEELAVRDLQLIISFTHAGQSYPSAHLPFQQLVLPAYSFP